MRMPSANTSAKCSDIVTPILLRLPCVSVAKAFVPMWCTLQALCFACSARGEGGATLCHALAQWKLIIIHNIIFGRITFIVILNHTCSKAFWFRGYLFLLANIITWVCDGVAPTKHYHPRPSPPKLLQLQCCAPNIYGLVWKCNMVYLSEPSPRYAIGLLRFKSLRMISPWLCARAFGFSNE